MQTTEPELGTSSASSLSVPQPTSDLQQTPSLSYLTLAIPEDIDTRTLESLFPDNLSPDLAKPTPDLVIALYRIALAHVDRSNNAINERDQIRAEATRLEVELEQAFQDQDAKTRQLETSLQEAHVELDQLKKEKTELVAKNAQLEESLKALDNSQSTSSSTVESLRRQVETVEREKRDLLEVLNRVREASAQREEDVAELRKLVKQTRTEITNLQSDIAEARSNETASTFRQQTLEQELELVRKENERHLAELNEQQEAASSDRRTRHAEVVRLQSEVDKLTDETSSLSSRYSSLQKSYQSQQAQLVQSLSQVQTLQATLNERTAQFKSEAEASKRLTALMETQVEEGTQRLQEAEELLAEQEQRFAAAQDRLQADLTKETKRADDLESSLSELRSITERMVPVIDTMASPSVSRFATPTRHGVPSTPSTGMSGFMLSPTANLATQLQKSGRSYTEVYADYMRQADELAKQKKETRRLEAALAQILSDIEERSPLIRNQREEYDRMSAELAQLSAQMGQLATEKEEAVRTSRDEAAALRKAKEENRVFQQQLTDLGRQVQSLLREIAIREDPSLADVEFTEQMDMPDDSASDSDNVISSNLVLFTSLPALQAQNQRLLRTARALATKLDADDGDGESPSWSREEAEEALNEASAAVKDMEDELQRQKTIASAISKERDMLRGMLKRAGHDVAPSTNATSAANGTDSQKLGEDQLAGFEAFRVEMSADMARLKEDLTTAQRELVERNATLGRAEAQVSFLESRIRLAEDEARRHEEMTSTQIKRINQLLESSNKVELTNFQIKDQLNQAHTTIERLRSESATIQVENRFHKLNNERIQEENRILLKEKMNLNNLVISLKTVQAEYERAADSDKGRLESQIRSFENQVQDLRQQLQAEIENSRRIAVQKDLEIRDYHARLDKLSQTLAQTQEAKSVAETSKSHLETRVDDLAKQLDAANHKLSIYERPGTSQTPQSEEDRLRGEVARLSAACQTAEADLAKASEHVEQFKNISQASEEALANLSASYDEYKADTDRELAAKTAELQALQESLDAARQQLEQARAESAKLGEQFEQQQATFRDEKRTWEGTVQDLMLAGSHAESDRQVLQRALTSKTAKLHSFEELYAREVAARGEDAKTILDLRAQLAGSSKTISAIQLEANAARSRLEGLERELAEVKEGQTQAIHDLTERCKNLSEQNDALHQHLADVTSKAERIRQAAEAAPPDYSAVNGPSVPSDADETVADLRKLIGYVRREKDILVTQLDMEKQEKLRLKSQVSYLDGSLENLRTMLRDERERASKSAVSAEEYAATLAKTEELNTLKNSIGQTRADLNHARAEANRYKLDIQMLRSELDPLREKNISLGADLEARKAEIQRLEEDNKRWKDRTEQILSKHNRTDPTEIQALRDEITELQAARDQLQTENESLKTALRGQKDAYGRLLEQSKTNFGRLNGEKAQLTTKITELTDENTQLKNENDELKRGRDDQQTSSSTEVSALQTRLATAETENARLETALKNEQRQAAEAASQNTATPADSSGTIATLTAERDALQSEITALRSQLSTPAATTEGEADVAALREQMATMEASLQELQKKEALFIKEHNAFTRLRSDNIKFMREAKEANARKAEMETQLQAALAVNPGASSSDAPAPAPSPDVEELVAKRVAEVAAEHEQKQSAAVAAATEALRAEVDALKAAAAAMSTSAPSGTDEEHAAELKALEARLTEKHAAELKTAVEEATAAASKDNASSAAPAVDIEARLAEEKVKWEAEKKAELEAVAADKAKMIEEAKASVHKEYEMRGKIQANQLKKAQQQLEEYKAKEIAAGASQTNPPTTAPKNPAPSRIPTGPAASNASSPTTATPAPAPTNGAKIMLGLPKSAANTNPNTNSNANPNANPNANSNNNRSAGLPNRPNGQAGPSRGTSIRGRGGRPSAPGRDILAAVNATTSGAAPANPPAPTQTSILGAAGSKRPRESDAGETVQNELAKRLRSGPVPLNRSRPIPNPPAPPPPGPSST